MRAGTLLDTITVNAGGKAIVPGKAVLAAETAYTLVVSGIETETSFGVTLTRDAMYCFRSATAGCTPGTNPGNRTAQSSHLFVGTNPAHMGHVYEWDKPAPGAHNPNSFYNPNPVYDYNASHVYTLPFYPAETGKFVAAPQEVFFPGSCACTGTYTIKVYSAGAAPAATPTPASTACGTTKDRRLASAEAINEVRVVAITPGVGFRKAGSSGEWCDVSKHDVLTQGDEISTDPDGSVTLAFADNSTVVVRNSTQIKISSFFTEGGVVRTEILLKGGEIAAQVNHSETTSSDFKVNSSGANHSGSVRGTKFTYFYDPVSKATVISVNEGVVAVTATAGGTATNVPAGKEVEVTTKVSAPAALGKAGARGGINRLTARKLVLKLVARGNGPCGLVTPRTGGFSVKPVGAGWLVSVRSTAGKAKGWSTWKTAGTKVSAANAAARKIAAGCR